jgi:hypothetical protein
MRDWNWEPAAALWLESNVSLVFIAVIATVSQAFKV